MKRLGTLFVLLLLHPQPAAAINFVFDYSYAGGTFLTDPTVQALLNSAAAQYTPFTDNLARIDPADFGAPNTWSARIEDPTTGSYPTDIVDLVVPEDTLIIYVGAMELGGTTAGSAAPGGWTIAYSDPAWLDTVDFRGQTGEPTGTDYGPWGGYISFDTTTNWNLAAGLPAFDEVDFLSVAVHELGHIMGIGPSPSWQAQVNFGTHEFTGTEAVNIYGSNVPLETDDSHFLDNLPGVPEPALDPVISTGARKLLTTLDYAAFADIGWDVPLALLPEPNTGLLLASAVLLLAGLSATRRGGRRHRAADPPPPHPLPARRREPRRSRGWAQARG
jgi:hypothetical protein